MDAPKPKEVITPFRIDGYEKPSIITPKFFWVVWGAMLGSGVTALLWLICAMLNQ